MARARRGLWFAGHRRTLIVDRAGALLPLCSVADVPKGAPKTVHSAIAKANAHRFGTAFRNIALMTVGYTVLFGAGRTFIATSVSDALARFVIWAVFAAFGAVIAGLAGRHAIDGAGRRALAECLRAGLCPSCCYDLNGAAPGGDTFVRCPECGGTWPGPASPASPV